MAATILGMLSAGSVNLAKVATQVQCGLKLESMYKRIQGFFTEFPLSLDEVSKFVLSFLNFDGKVSLAFDRTNWKLGKKNINYFVLAICYRGVSVPVLWRSLDKQGCSSDSERVELLERFNVLFGLDRVSDLLGDREFASHDLMAYLSKHGVPYTLRVRGNLNIEAKKGKPVKIASLFKHLHPGEAKTLMNREVLGVMTNICALKDKHGDLKIIITDKPICGIERYEEREQIERMFSCLKSRGFDLESTHITEPGKLERLLGVVTIAFCWAYKMGDHIDEDKPIPRKKHGRRIRSVFKTGHVYLKNLLAGLGKRSWEYTNVLALLFYNDQTAKPHINWGYL